MRLSEFSTDRALDVLCELTPHINNIFSDSELLDELKTAADLSNAKTLAEQIAKLVSKISKLVPILLRKKKEDVYEILAIVNEKEPDEIAKQNFLVTAKQIRDIVKDKELIDFFKSCTDAVGSE